MNTGEKIFVDAFISFYNEFVKENKDKTLEEFIKYLETVNKKRL